MWSSQEGWKQFKAEYWGATAKMAVDILPFSAPYPAETWRQPPAHPLLHGHPWRTQESSSEQLLLGSTVLQEYQLWSSQTWKCSLMFSRFPWCIIVGITFGKFSNYSETSVLNSTENSSSNSVLIMSVFSLKSFLLLLDGRCSYAATHTRADLNIWGSTLEFLARKFILVVLAIAQH